MKTFISIVVCLIISMTSFSQDIEFRQGSWQEMLAAARAENKMLLTDFTTVWCGVCRMMEKHVFTEKKVSDFFNKNFICYHLDAEKGEGKEIAKRYEIGSFPTFLFVDGAGNTVHKSVGYMNSDEFLAEGRMALQEFRSGVKSMEAWEAEYSRKKNQASFVRKYIKRLRQLKKDHADVLDQYCRLATKKDLQSPDFLEWITDRGVQINADGPCYQYIITHLPAICTQANIEESNYLFLLRESVLEFSLRKAIRQQNDSLFALLTKINADLMVRPNNDSTLSALKLNCRYYLGTQNAPEYEKNALQQAKYLLKDKERLQQADSLQYVTFLNALANSPAKLDSLVSDYNYMKSPLDADILHRALEEVAHGNIRTLSYALSDLAKQASRIAHTPAFQQQVLLWAVEAVALYDHFSNESALAEVMYAAGHRTEAIRWMQNARGKFIRDTKRTDGFAKQMQEKIRKMQRNEAL